MNRILIVLGVVGILFLGSGDKNIFFEGVVHAQEPGSSVTTRIIAQNSVEVGKNIILRAEAELVPEGRVVSYLWEFGDGQFSSQEEDVHIFQKPGRYNVKLKVTWLAPGAQRSEVTETIQEIFVFERLFVLITDAQQTPERLQALRNRAEDQNIYLRIIQIPDDLRFTSEPFPTLEDSLSEIRQSDTVMIWSDRSDLLTLLNSFSDRLQLQQKQLVVIAEGNVQFLKNILLSVYELLAPDRIIITRREALDEFFITQADQDVFPLLQSRGYDAELINQEDVDEFSLLALPSYGIGYLQKKGLEDSVLLLVLFLPLIVTLVTFLRLVIGFSPVGARLPIIFTYSLLILGWKLGILVVLLLAMVSYLFRIFLFKSHLLYAAKVGVLTSTLGVLLLFIMGAAVYLDLTIFNFSSALMIVVVAIMIDRIAGGVEGEKGFYYLMRIFFETLIIASVCYGFISWPWLQILLLAHPEILLAFILANIIMGRFTGLRLFEYFRFREVLRHGEEE